MQHLCQLRRHYIQLYAGSLQQISNINNSDIRDIEKDLDPKVILLWRYDLSLSKGSISFITIFVVATVNGLFPH